MDFPELSELERLLETSNASLMDPSVQVRAIVNDALISLGMEALDLRESKRLAPEKNADARDAVVKLSCRLLLHPFFKAWAMECGPEGRESLLTAILSQAGERARERGAEHYAADPDGREELSRVVLSGIGARPAGETQAQAENRLKAVDSIERKKVMERAKQAEKRSREIREALERKEAEEAASKMSRE